MNFLKQYQVLEQWASMSLIYQQYHSDLNFESIELLSLQISFYYQMLLATEKT